ncbi:MAG: hypothetical protein LC800_05525 [Acidobacteria bacterium]|nr:hypothetical protein [Acidobacteriota bacterium]
MLTAELGLQLPDAVGQSPAVAASLRQAEVTAAQVGDSAAGLDAALAARDEIRILEGFLRIGSALGEFYKALDALAFAVRAAVTPATVPDAGARAAAEEFALTLAKRLSDYALASAITEQSPDLGFALKLAGLLDWQYQSRDATNELSQGHVRKRLRLDRVRGLISDPARHLRETIGWGAPGFDPTGFFSVVREFFDEEASIVIGVQDGEPFLRGCVLVRRDSTVSPPGLTVTLIGEANADRRERTEFDEEWGINVESSFRLVGGVTGRLTPPLTLSLRPLSGEITGELLTFADRNADARPFDVVGGTGGLLLVSAKNVAAGLGLKAEWNAAEREATINPLVFGHVEGLTLKLGTKDADSFIGKLLGAARVEGEFDLGLEWTASTGLRVTASGGIEIALPIHRQLGPAELQTIYLALRILPDSTLSLEVSTALAGKLGPLNASVDRLGALADLRFAEGSDARFGPFDLSLRFKPPNGIGLGIDAGVIKGGGYVYLDPAKGEYAGALELTFAGFLSLKAVALINTRLPGGQPGFSLLVIITAEFDPGLQLGFGFTLLGVGGLLGLNRTVLLDPLLQGVRTGALGSILFPTDVIANAPRILSDLRAIFPPREGTFLIGPMAKIGWGAPTIISVALGIIIEIPGNVVILGRLRVAIPTDDAAVLVLQVSFIGAIEFDKRRLWFFATLFESRVLFLTLEGEMGLMMDFGDDPNFVLSVGGFHPRFTPPPLPFASPARIAVTLINESWARVRSENYFAVTPNTVQMGSRSEAFFGFDAFSVEGHFNFDALIRFSPFYFIVEISVSFAVKIFGLGLFSVHLRATLEGATPWRIRGSAEIGFFFFSFDVDVDVTFGERRADTLPPIEVLPRLRQEFEKLESWRATLPPAGQLFVSLRELGGAGQLVLHPVGTLQISQRFAPLNFPLDRVGSQKPSDVKRVTAGAQAGSLAVKGATREKFAPAQFREMDDAAKLSAPAFEPLDSGVELGAAGQTWATGPLAKRVVRYETIIVDTALEPLRLRFFKFLDGLFSHFLGGASVARASASLANERQRQPFADKVAVSEDKFTVAFQADSRPYSPAAVFGSYAEAQSHLEAAVRAEPALFETIHVVPSAEVNRAA